MPPPGTFAGEVYLLNTFGHIRHQMLKHPFLIVCHGVDTTSSAPANRCVKAIPPWAQHRASGCRHGLRRHTRGPSPASPRIQKVARLNPVVSGEENTRAEFSVNRVGEALRFRGPQRRIAVSAAPHFGGRGCDVMHAGIVGHGLAAAKRLFTLLGFPRPIRATIPSRLS